MSHEWNCRCPRCERDALLDTLDDDRAEAEEAEHDELLYRAHVAD